MSHSMVYSYIVRQWMHSIDSRYTHYTHIEHLSTLHTHLFSMHMVSQIHQILIIPVNISPVVATYNVVEYWMSPRLGWYCWCFLSHFRTAFCRLRFVVIGDDNDDADDSDVRVRVCFPNDPPCVTHISLSCCWSECCCKFIHLVSCIIIIAISHSFVQLMLNIQTLRIKHHGGAIVRVHALLFTSDAHLAHLCTGDMRHSEVNIQPNTRPLYLYLF